MTDERSRTTSKKAASKPSPQKVSTVQSDLSAPPIRSYKTSLGAASTDESLRRLAERNLYNSVDFRLQGKAFDGVSAHELAALKHQACLMYQGSIVWAQLAEDYRDAARLLAGEKNCFEHPVWIGVFRHASLAPSKDEGDKFIGTCLDADLVGFDWMTTSESIRGEWCLYDYMFTAALPDPLKDDALTQVWFPTPGYRESVVLAALNMGADMNQVADIDRCMALLQDINADATRLDRSSGIPAAFAVARARAKALALRSDFVGAETLMREGWDALCALDAAEPGAIYWLERLKGLRDQWVGYCKTLQDDAGRTVAMTHWRDALEQALAAREGTPQ